jgi:diaminopimelate epimerase
VTIRFTKMQAGGNDFIVIDDAAGRLGGAASALAKRLCHRRFGIGADGLLLLGRSAPGDRFRLRFVNSNGLVGEMCGNGVRCLAAFVHRTGLADRQISLDTDAGEVRAVFHDASHIGVELPAPVPGRRGIGIEHDGRIWHFDELDVGPPHVVCLLDDGDRLEQVDVVKLGRRVREHSLFAPRGCNVNFVIRTGPDSLAMRTYERGVEDETLCCGTGASASAIIARDRLGLPDRITVACSGGDTLVIDLSDAGRPLLVGGAHFIATGEVDSALLDDPALARP